MLENISNQEQRQLTNIKTYAVEAFNESLQKLRENKEDTHRRSFEQALEGIRKGEMDYNNDLVKVTMLEVFKNKTSEL